MQNNFRDEFEDFLYNHLQYTNAPHQRGADYPPFDPLSINEKNIPDNMRSKYSEASKIGEDNNKVEYMIAYITQEEFNDTDSGKFFKEVERAISYWEDNIKKSKPEKQYLIQVIVTCGDGEQYGYDFATIELDGPDSVIE